MASRARKTVLLLGLGLALIAPIGLELTARHRLTRRVEALRDALFAPLPDGRRPALHPVEPGDAADCYLALEWLLAQHFDGQPEPPVHPLPPGDWQAGMPEALDEDLYALDLVRLLRRTGDTARVVLAATDIAYLGGGKRFAGPADLPRLLTLAEEQRARYRPLLALLRQAASRERCRWVESLAAWDKHPTATDRAYMVLLDLLALEIAEAPPLEAVDLCLEAVAMGLDRARQPLHNPQLAGLATAAGALDLVAEQLGQSLDSTALTRLRDGLEALELPPAEVTFAQETLLARGVLARRAGYALDVELAALREVEPGPWYESFALVAGLRWSRHERALEAFGEALGMPWPERIVALDQLETEVEDDEPLADLVHLLRRWDQTRQDQEVVHRCLVLLCELRLFALREGRWPRPGELAPVPDPYAPSRRLSWSLEGGRLRAWSVGADGEDDVGRITPEGHPERPQAAAYPGCDAGAEVWLEE